MPARRGTRLALTGLLLLMISAITGPAAFAANTKQPSLHVKAANTVAQGQELKVTIKGYSGNYDRLDFDFHSGSSCAKTIADEDKKHQGASIPLTPGKDYKETIKGTAEAKAGKRVVCVYLYTATDPSGKQLHKKHEYDVTGAKKATLKVQAPSTVKKGSRLTAIASGYAGQYDHLALITRAGSSCASTESGEAAMGGFPPLPIPVANNHNYKQTVTFGPEMATGQRVLCVYLYKATDSSGPQLHRTHPYTVTP